MIGGNVRNAKPEKGVIILNVRGKGCEKYDECKVRVPNDRRGKWFINAIGRVSINVWWQKDKLFATFGELGEYKFKKISNSYGHRHI